MARTAEYSIKGYLYQFLQYLREILAADAGATVTIEGAIEDIDVVGPNFTTAVQCKYHEQAESFTLGKIYKPILLMYEHFSKHSTSVPEVHYRLFCHFPGKTGVRGLSPQELAAAMATTAAALKPITARVAPGADSVEFIKRFKIEFGQSAEELQDAVLVALKARGFTAEDVEAIIFPNAIQRIVNLATLPEIAERTVEPAAFLQSLRDVRHVTFTRWTRELATRAQIFKRLRQDLKPSLAHNSRGRHFVIDPTAIDNFDDDAVRFIKAFVERYSSKYLHDNPPLFAITGEYDVGRLQARLHDAGLRCAVGQVGEAEVRIDELFRAPMRKRSPLQIEFRLRLVKRAALTESCPVRPDELFLVNVAQDPWTHSDINVHRFEIERLSDLEYALQLRNNYA